MAKFVVVRARNVVQIYQVLLIAVTLIKLAVSVVVVHLTSAATVLANSGAYAQKNV